MLGGFHSQKRDYWFDNAKTILIIIVVVAHMAELLVKCVDFPNGVPLWLNTIYKGTYIYHMPVFMIISGRFSRKRIDQNDYVSVINKLLIPYLCIQTVMMLLYAFLGYQSVKNFSYLSPLFGIWYIFSLIVYQLITPHLKRFKGLFVISLILAIVIQYGAAVPAGGFMRLITYYPFFLFGYQFFRDDQLAFCKKQWFRAISLLAFVLLIILVALNNSNLSVGALTLRRVFSAFKGTTELEFLLFTLIRYSLGFLFFFFIMGISPEKEHFFSYMGTQSTYIYLLHLFIIVTLESLGKNYGLLQCFQNEWLAMLFVLEGLPLSFFLAWSPVRKATAWLVAPNFDIRQIVKRIIRE